MVPFRVAGQLPAPAGGSQVKAHRFPVDSDIEDGPRICVHPASPEAVDFVLAQPVGDWLEMPDDGRSPWMWIRLPSGDLILGVFPYGDTYFAVEEDAEYPGDADD